MTGSIHPLSVLLGAALTLGAPLVLAENGPVIGAEAPKLIARSLDDKLYLLSHDKERPKVMNFFWVQCVPCKAEMPELAKLETAYPKVEFISVHASSESAEEVAKFIQGLPGAPSRIVVTQSAARDAFNVKGLPHTIVMNQKNIVLGNLVGYTPKNMTVLKKMLEELSK
jgi:thiol-disulfide isomerase/thioredoxin